MQPELHLAWLFVIHGSAQLVVNNKLVVGSAEGIKHFTVVGREPVPRHCGARKEAHCKADLQIKRAEEQNNKTEHRADEPGYKR